MLRLLITNFWISDSAHKS